MSIAEKVARRRTELGLKQADVMRLTEIPSSRLSELENGKYNPPYPVLLKVARALQTTVDYLIDDEQKSPPAVEVAQEERELLTICRALGVTLARRRLLGLPDEDPSARSRSDRGVVKDAETYAEQKARESREADERERQRRGRARA